MNYKEVISLINKIEKSKFTNFKIKYDDLELELEKKSSGCKKEYDDEDLNINDVVFEEEEQNTSKPKVVNEIPVFEDLSQYNAVTSPIVGVFYTKPAPDKEPFIKVGDKVKKGDVLCIVEAMKVLNEIKSDFDGEIVKIDVNNEDVVEFNQPLIYIK